MAIHYILATLGGLLLVGMLTDEIGRRTRLPRVTLLILFGFIAGPSGFSLLPSEINSWYEFLAVSALTMVAFLLGSKLSVSALRKHGREIFIISSAAVALTVLIVFVGLLVAGSSLALALVLAAIATATAPAATQDVIRQTGASGPFTERLLGIVAVDDAWGLIVFAFLLVAAKYAAGVSADGVFSRALWEIGGAIGVGLLIGLPASFLTGWLRAGDPTQAEALGIVFLCGGISIWLDVSFLLSGIVAGATIVNLARRHKSAFHEIEQGTQPVGRGLSG